MKWTVLYRIPSSSHDIETFVDTIEADGFAVFDHSNYVSFFMNGATEKEERHVAIYSGNAFIKAFKALDD